MWQSTLIMLGTAGLAAVLAFGIGMVMDPHTPEFADHDKQRVHFVYGWATWVFIGVLFVLHFSVEFGAAIRTRAMRGMLAVYFVGMTIGFLCVIAAGNASLAWYFYIARYGYHSLVLVLGLRLCVDRVERKSPGLLPPQLPDKYMFPIMYLSFVVSWASTLNLPSLINSLILVVTVLSGVASFTLAFMRIRRDPALARQFDWAVLFYGGYHMTRVLARLLPLLLGTSFGSQFPVVVVFAFRGLFTVFTLFIDDLLIGAYGKPLLWGSFFMRLADTLASTLATLNSTTSWTDLAVFAGGNLVLTLVKDVGFLDDLSLLHERGFSLVINPPSVAAVPRPSLKRDTAVSSPVESAKSSTSLLLPRPKKPRAVALERSTLRALAIHLALQIERSEQTLIARIVATVAAVICYATAVATRRTCGVRLTLYPGAEVIGTAVLAIIVAEMVTTRAAAVAAFRWKIQRVERMRTELRMHRRATAVAESGGGAEGVPAAAALPPIAHTGRRGSLMAHAFSMKLVKTELKDATQGASLASVHTASALGEDAAAPPSAGPGATERPNGWRAVQVGTTRLPTDRVFRWLTLASAVFVSASIFGPPTTQ
ncbi:hypothetical protein H9P43_004888 [Blastocladiella emersonii ATCC 22665]|nr:hypothetical protein H9P43_004888 [Blastocladiella emersonii ATCC 22665]